MKKLITLLGICTFALTSVSCESEKKKATPPPPVIVEAPDYGPIGEGWKVQSYALVGIVVIVAVVVMGKSN
jgi:hypothetical protein